MWWRSSKQHWVTVFLLQFCYFQASQESWLKVQGPTSTLKRRSHLPLSSTKNNFLHVSRYNQCIEEVPQVIWRQGALQNYKNVTVVEKEIVSLCIPYETVIDVLTGTNCLCLTLWSYLTFSYSKPRQKLSMLTLMKGTHLSCLDYFE